MKKVDCKRYTQEILDEAKAKPNKGKLYILYAGNDPASAAYMRGKLKDCAYCGIPVEQIKCESEDEMLKEIYKASIWRSWPDMAAGIIVQLPLPDGWNTEKILAEIPDRLDVDGFSSTSDFQPCTPAGIMYIMHKELGEDLSGKSVLLVGKGKLVGKPLIQMLLDEGCTLTVAHSKTKDFGKLLWQRHDIVVTAVGRADLVNLELVDADLVIDAGITRNAEGKLCGDCCNFKDTENGTKVTTVPGGVGLMTRAMLMHNVALASK